MSEKRTVLVTGAGGFIGGRVVEVLHTLGTGDVRAGIRRWASGARIGRLPVEIVQCDIRDDAQVRAALDGVTHVVHCAVGDRTTTVEGTRTLLTAAADLGVERVVHLSTVDVYGTPEGEVDETRPLTMTGKAYGDSKIEAEEVCRQAAGDGLHVTILRPSLVHGPFSAVWTIGYAQRLKKRPWLIHESDAQGTCNLVYVDDLVGAVLAAFEADSPSGEAFNVNGPDRPTWHQYFQALNDAMGLPPLVTATPTGARMKAGVVQPLRRSAKFLITHFEAPIKGIAKRSRVARAAMKRAEEVIRTTPAPAEMPVYGRRTSYATSKAEEMLGYRARFPMADAMALTGAWLEHHEFAKNGSG